MDAAIEPIDSVNTDLEKYFDLLQLAPDEPVRRYVALQILDHILQEQVPLQSLREAITAVLSALGPRDTQSRNGILSLLTSDHYRGHVESRDAILNFLPCTILPERQSTIDVIKVLCSLCQQDETAIVPILNSIALFPEESGRDGFLYEVSLQMLPLVGKVDLPVLLRTLLQSVSVEEQANRAIPPIRMALNQLEQEIDHDFLIMEVLALVPYLTNHSEPDSGKLLAKAFLKEWEAHANKNHPDQKYLLVELVAIILLAEQSAYMQRSNRLLDLLLSRNAFPWEQLSFLIGMLVPDKTGSERLLASPLSRQVSQALLRMSIFLLLAPARMTENQNQVDATNKFVLLLHNNLSQELQIELVHSLLCLSEEVMVVETAHNDFLKRRRGQKQKSISAQQCIIRSIHVILKHISESSPKDIARFRSLFFKRLMKPVHHSESREFCRALCSIIVNSVARDGFGTDDLMKILRKLLFSTSDTAGRNYVAAEKNNCWTILRGFFLATEMVQCPNFDETQKLTIHDWILNILMPTSRRMVEPVLGSPGLLFLQTWKSLREKNDNFQHLKMILSNTGLIQLASFYEQNNITDAVIGYNDQAEYLNLSENLSSPKKMRKIIICVNSFLRRIGSNRVSRWSSSRTWVNDLVDDYLTEGRENGSNWQPEGWLMATIEFPLIDFPSDTNPATRRHLEEWIVKNLCIFELSTEKRNEKPLPQEKATQYISSLNRRQFHEFESSLFGFVLSLIISTSLLTTILLHSFERLKNAEARRVDHHNMNDTSFEEHISVLVKVQLMKIFDLMKKMDAVETILTYMKSCEDKTFNKPKSSEHLHVPDEDSDHFKQNGSVEVDDSATEVVNQMKLFRHSHFRLCALWDILWVCLDLRDEEALKDFIRTSASRASGQSCNMTLPEFFRRVDLQINILENLRNLIDKSKTCSIQVEKDQFQHCARMTYFILDILPLLRKTFIKMNGGVDNGILFAVINLGESYSSVLSALLYNSFIMDKDSDNNFHWNQTIEWFDVFIDNPRTNRQKLTTTSWPTVSSIFFSFQDRLMKAEYSKIASQILEILSVLAIQDSRQLLRPALDLSWIFLHTIFIDERNGVIKEKIPWSLTISCTNVYGGALHTLMRNIWSKIESLFDGNRSRDCVLISLRQELNLLLRQWDKQVTCPDEDDDSSDEFTIPRRNHKPSIFGLEPGTMLEYFEILLYIVVGSTSISLIEMTSNDHEPYGHLFDCCKMFKQLVELYEDYFLLFPSRGASCLASACRDMLEASMLQIRQCAEWRNTKPLMSVAEKQDNAFDPGSVSNFENLLHEVSSNIIGTVFDLCDFLKRDSAWFFVAKSSSLRTVTDKSARTLKAMALEMNLTLPSFTKPKRIRLVDQRVNNTKGFHDYDLPPVNAENHERITSKTRPKRKLDDENDLLFDEDDGLDFCVTGRWGGVSNESESAGTLSLQRLSAGD